MKLKRLRSDGSYSSDQNMICAYSEQGHERKKQFLRDAAALLRETAKQLTQHGLTQSDVRTNRAGVAVSGEVTADFWNPETGRGVWLAVSSAGLSFLSGRQDGVAILARWRTYKAKPTGRSKYQKRLSFQSEGPNQWLSPDLDSQQLATALVKIYSSTFRDDHDHATEEVHPNEKATSPAS